MHRRIISIPSHFPVDVPLRASVAVAAFVDSRHLALTFVYLFPGTLIRISAVQFSPRSAWFAGLSCFIYNSYISHVIYILQNNINVTQNEI